MEFESECIMEMISLPEGQKAKGIVVLAPFTTARAGKLPKNQGGGR
jgi:hypothetical protein